MSVFLEKLNEQAKYCKHILTVLQNERKFYQKKEKVSPQEVILILKRKQKMVLLFEENQFVISNMKKNLNENPIEEKEINAVIRNLSIMAEQLLVLDSENEKMIKKIMHLRNHKRVDSIKTTVQAVKKTVNIQNTKQINMPFVPNNNLMSLPINHQTRKVNAANPYDTNNARPVARRNKLKTYSTAKNMLNTVVDKYI